MQLLDQPKPDAMKRLSWLEFRADAASLVQLACGEGWRSRSAWPALELIEDRDLVRTTTRLPFTIFNNVIESRLDAANLETSLDDALARLKMLPANSTWWVGGATLPRDLALHLQAKGFTQEIPADAIAIALQCMPPPASKGRLDIVEVDEPARLATWVEIEAEVYGFPAELAGLWQAMQVTCGFGPRQRWRHYLGLVSGRPSGTVSAFHGERAVVFSNLAVLQQAQGRGLGSAMLSAALQEARREGYEVGVGVANRHSRGICQRLGFRSVGSFSFVSVGPHASQALHLSGKRVT